MSSTEEYQQEQFWNQPDKWAVGLVKCDICTYDWVGVRLNYLTKLECPNCNNLTTFEILNNGKNNK